MDIPVCGATYTFVVYFSFLFIRVMFEFVEMVNVYTFYNTLRDAIAKWHMCCIIITHNHLNEIPAELMANSQIHILHYTKIRYTVHIQILYWELFVPLFFRPIFVDNIVSEIHTFNCSIEFQFEFFVLYSWQFIFDLITMFRIRDTEPKYKNTVFIVGCCAFGCSYCFSKSIRNKFSHFVWKGMDVQSDWQMLHIFTNHKPWGLKTIIKKAWPIYALDLCDLGAGFKHWIPFLCYEKILLDFVVQMRYANQYSIHIGWQQWNLFRWI